MTTTTVSSQLPSTSNMAVIAAAAAAGLYLQNDLTNVKADIEQIKTQLSTVILQVNNKQKIIQLENVIKVLIEELRIVKQHLKTQSQNSTHSQTHTQTQTQTQNAQPHNTQTKQDFISSTLDSDYEFVTKTNHLKTMAGNIHTTDVDEDAKIMLAGTT